MNKERIAELQRKAELCNQASKKVRGQMRTIWQQKRNALLYMANNLIDAEAEASRIFEDEC